MQTASTTLRSASDDQAADTHSARPLIQLGNVRKVYRTDDIETTALDGITMQITAREFVAIMGPSGCGKSTLLNVIAMIDTPTSGTYRLDGVEVSSLNETQLADVRKRTIGFIFQSFNLLDDLSVYENVELPLLYQGIPQATRRSRVREVLELVDLMHRANHRPAQLSGGQQQRVAVARAVVSNPLLIVADEPTGNLDTQHGEEIMDMLRSLNEQGTTIVIVTHSPEHAARAHRVLYMRDGRFVRE